MSRKIRPKPNLAKKVGQGLRKASPTIMTCIGAFGVVATAVLAVKATPKALERVEKATDEKMAEKGEELTKIETVGACWTCYAPAALTGIATIGCIFGANTLNRRQQAALSSAYALLDRTYRNYQQSVKHVFGEDGHKRVLQDMAVQKVDSDHTIYTEGAFESTTLDFGIYEEEHMFYDAYSDRQFTSTIGKVLQAEYHLNRMLAINGGVSLNELYKFLGIDPIKGGDDIGWWVDYENEVYWVDFNHVTSYMDDGPNNPEVECLIIEFPHPPCPPPPDL